MLTIEWITIVSVRGYKMHFIIICDVRYTITGERKGGIDLCVAASRDELQR